MENKYLKYKNKYLRLKNLFQKGGTDGMPSISKEGNWTCTCEFINSNKQTVCEICGKTQPVQPAQLLLHSDPEIAKQLNDLIEENVKSNSIIYEKYGYAITSKHTLRGPIIIRDIITIRSIKQMLVSFSTFIYYIWIDKKSYEFDRRVTLVKSELPVELLFLLKEKPLSIIDEGSNLIDISPGKQSPIGSVFNETYGFKTNEKRFIPIKMYYRDIFINTLIFILKYAKIAGSLENTNDIINDLNGALEKYCHFFGLQHLGGIWYDFVEPIVNEINSLFDEPIIINQCMVQGSSGDANIDIDYGCARKLYPIYPTKIQKGNVTWECPKCTFVNTIDDSLNFECLVNCGYTLPRPVNSIKIVLVTASHEDPGLHIEEGYLLLKKKEDEKLSSFRPNIEKVQNSFVITQESIDKTLAKEKERLGLGGGGGGGGGGGI